MGVESASISALVAQLADDASTLVRTEVELYRALALNRLAQSSQALGMLAGALILSIAGICTLLVMLAVGLANWIGPVGAGIVVSLGALAIAGVLAKQGASRLADALDVTDGEES
ncbi:MAG: phage holin family protein [Sphingomonadaceae bacterium]